MTTENTTVSTVSPVVPVAPPKKRDLVKERVAKTLEGLKTVLADGTARGPSDIARLLNEAGFTSPTVWTDAYALLKGGGFGIVHVEGAKRAKYFLPGVIPVSEVPSEHKLLEEELGNFIDGLHAIAALGTPVEETAVVEEVAPVPVAEPEVPVAPVTKKNKKAKKDATPAVEVGVVEEAKAA